MAADDSNFFSRWSRRKVQERAGQPLPADPPVVVPAVVPVAAPVVAPVQQRASEPHVPAASPSSAAAQPEAEAPPALTLEDVAKVTPKDDFAPFMARQVSPEVRNAAVKKLFTDPHFNVMDGLDIYIDDYSIPSPLSAADMAQMVGAQFLKLVDDPAQPAQPPVPAADPTPAADTRTDPAPVANDTTAPDAATPEEIQDDHADLQLQPDHAPERESPGRGAG
jgi:hypothetical protein